MTRFAVLAGAVLLLATPAAADEESKSLDLVARPNQLPGGFAEYGVLLGFPAGPELDPPVAEWKYGGLGAWITATAFAQVGVTDNIEVDGTATLSIGHPENTPGARPNRFGGVELAGIYKLADGASVRAGLGWVDPWLALYGLTTFQHYFMDSEAKLAAHVGGRFGTTVAKRVRVQATARLTVVANAVDDGSTSETWLLGELGLRANTRVYDDFFAGLRTGVRTGDKLSPDPTDGATVPAIVELRYVAPQVDLGVDVGFGSLLTSNDLMSRVAYAKVPNSVYFGAVINWRLD